MTEPRGTVGASDAAALFDAHPYLSRYALYMRETGMLRHVQDERTERQQMGLDLEKPVLEIWARREGRHIEHNTTSFTAPSLPGMSATPDGLEIGLAGGRRATADVKTVEPWERRAWLDGIPRHHAIQKQAQMAVCGVPRGYLIAIFGVSEIAGTTVAPDYDLQARLVERVEEFWRQVRGEIPPPEPDDHRATLAAQMARERVRKTVDFGDRRIAEMMARHDTEYREATAARIAADKREARAKAAILNALADADAGVFADGSGYRVETIVQQRRASEPKTVVVRKLTRFTGENTEEGDE